MITIQPIYVSPEWRAQMLHSQRQLGEAVLRAVIQMRQILKAHNLLPEPRRRVSRGHRKHVRRLKAAARR